jgi:pyruvate/2-oxoglutarate dehydrogenase complex dihydrolipoamide acyltransferase (E2) component
MAADRMRREIKMPNLGYDMDEGKLISWLKSPGDHVERGEAIAEIETDKTTIEMESLVTGTLVEILCTPGDSAKVGVPIGIIEGDE